MATTTLIPTPPLKVSRPVSACTRCRKAKTKCDGGLPACSACVRADKASECTSASDQFARGRERSYVTALESRIDRLRREVDQLRHSQKHNDQHLSPSATGVHEGTSIAQIPRQKDAGDVNDLVSDFGYLSVNATASGYQGFVKEMSFARLLFSTASVEDLPMVTVTSLPPREFAVRLIEECQRKVLQFCPVLTSNAIFRALDAAYQHNGQFSSPQDRWNLRMVLAIGSLCRSRAKGDVQYQSAISHVAAALEHSEIVVQPGSLSSIESLVLLTLYSLMDPSHFKAWYVIGVTARIMVDMGLHTDVSADPTIKPAQLDTRRRVFYCVYTLDRAITMTQVRAFSFTDASVQVTLPAPLPPNLLGMTNGFSTAVAPHVSLDIIKARRLQSVSYQNVFLINREDLYKRWPERVSMLNDLHAEMQFIIDNLPDNLKPILRSELYYFSLLLLQPPGGEQALGPYGEVLAFHYAVDYVQNTWLVCDQSWTESCCTALDLDRTLRVCRWLLDRLPGDYSPALSAADPPGPALPPNQKLPPLQPTSPEQRKAFAVSALTQMDQIIDVLGARFGLPMEQAGFSTAQNGSRRTPTSYLDHASIRQEAALTLERLLTQV